ncbi:hypothetical protein MUN74_12090 [Agromyces endophyticus]|uniref:GIY-YIG nuclease family protein n=1 Tax=Agromyces sp. H17E-10 TaxID=2932244 RepID=UPI001FD3C9C6|nr:hypothetical protein [Agromyces sp. H17E-10]UOQ88033.1 hypothetical protein MUN74_12090 [Agromyces sp. H17E-10]
MPRRGENLDIDEDAVNEAAEMLARRGEQIDVLRTSVPDLPGLYAFHADASVWLLLGLESSDGPLYVGKAERSLRSRDVRTHFEAGKTGSSTVRRSFAALLHDELSLRAIPRNPAKPAHFASFGLEPVSDARLSEWMHERLTLSWWASPANLPVRPFERAVIFRFQPPLNLTDVERPSPRLKAARAHLAREAAAWRPTDEAAALT